MNYLQKHKKMVEQAENGWTSTTAEFAEKHYGKNNLINRMKASTRLRNIANTLGKKGIPFGIDGRDRGGYKVYEILKDEAIDPAFAKTGTKLNRGVVRETKRIDVYVENKPELITKATKEIQEATLSLSNAIIKVV